MGFVWHGLGNGGPTGMSSVRSCQKLLPCQMMSVPAKTDPLLAKAEPSAAWEYLCDNRFKNGGKFLHKNICSQGKE